MIPGNAKGRPGGRPFALPPSNSATRMRSHKPTSASTHCGWSFRQGTSTRSSPPAARNAVRPSSPISSRVSMQSATNAGHITSSFFTPSRASLSRVASV